MSLGTVGRGALLATFGGAGVAAYQYQKDEGTRRSAYFWSRVMPMYLHYRWVQSQVKHLPDEEQDKAYAPLHAKYAPKALEIILHLRGFYIKIGQVASTRHDFLPIEYMEKVTTLQDEVPAEEFPYVKEVIEDSTKKKIYEVFKEFDHKPIGSASIGQVHRAVLKDGREVAVKVMYPQVERLFRTDIQTIKNFCRLAQPEHLPMINEIEKQFMTEFDYTKEARNLEMIRRNMSRRYGRRVRVPKPFFSTQHVLTMEFLNGEKLDKALKRNLEALASVKGVAVASLLGELREREARGEHITGSSRDEMWRIRTYLRLKNTVVNSTAAVNNWVLRPLSLFLLPKMHYRQTELPLNLAAMMDLLLTVHGQQILEDGCFNGDPHPGNILLLRPSQQLGLIDCGQVKNINLEQRLLLARLIVALAEGDKEAVVRHYKTMGFRTKYNDPEMIFRHASVAFDRCDKESLGGVNVQEYIEQLNRKDPVVSMPDDYIMAARVCVLLRGLGYALKYRYSTAQHWAPIARKLLHEYGADVPDTV